MSANSAAKAPGGGITPTSSTGSSASARTGMMFSTRTIAGAATKAISEPIKPRLVYCSPITHPLRWLAWIRFGLNMSGD